MCWKQSLISICALLAACAGGKSTSSSAGQAAGQSDVQPAGQGTGQATGQSGAQSGAQSPGTQPPAPTPAPSPPADTSLAGVYSNPHTVQMLGQDDWEDAQVSDCLSLETQPGGALGFEFLLVHTNAHTCGMSGIASPAGQGIWKFSEVLEGREGQPECRLEIRVSDKEITLSDNDTCRGYYCGARASIEGTSFARTTRKDGKGCEL